MSSTLMLPPDTCTTLPGERWDQIAYRISGDSVSYRKFITENAHLSDIYENGHVRRSLPGGLILRIPEVEKTNSLRPPWRA